MRIGLSSPLCFLCTLILLLSITPTTTSTSCPCRPQPIESDHYRDGRNLTNTKLRLCLSATTDLILENINKALPDVEVKFLALGASDEEVRVNCHVYFKILEHQAFTDMSLKSNLCPGHCQPIPIAIFPMLWFRDPDRVDINRWLSFASCSYSHNNSPVAISANKQSFTNRAKEKDEGHSIIIRSLFWRRIMECYENKIWEDSFSKSHFARSLEHNHELELSPSLLAHRRRRDNIRPHLWLRGAGRAANTQAITSSSQSKNAATSTLDLISRTPVRAVVIWVGSHANVELIHHQSTVLSGYPRYGRGAVIPWAATEATYPCQQSAIKCLGTNKHLKYIPGSAMNYMPAGWACAQRRPLRVLAHILTFLDPDFIILGDDDTFINYPLFIRNYGYFIDSEMLRAPIYLGEFVGASGNTGHLTTQGLFAGGSGYVLGKNLLERLAGYSVRDFQLSASSPIARRQTSATRAHKRTLIEDEDEYRSEDQIKYLSVAAEGMHVSRDACPAVNQTDLADTADSCILSYQPTVSQHFAYIDNTNGMYKETRSVTSAHFPFKNVTEYSLPTSVRLIDFCSNLMANENTCQHSDHSLGRCLVYGAFASPVGIVCDSTDPDKSHALPDYIRLGFCFMTPHCDVQKHMTCHRYRPSIPRGVHSMRNSSKERTAEPIRTSNKRGHYVKLSSTYNGKITDSYM